MPNEVDVQFGELAIQHKLITRHQREEAFELLKKLEAQLKSQGLLKKKKPRLVDVLVQKKMITGVQAKSIENARVYRQMRLDDKLYGRVAIKSKLAKPNQIEKALEAQKQAYLDKEDPPRVADYLLKKKWITEDQDQAIRSAISKLDAEDYVGKDARKRKKSTAASSSGKSSGLGSGSQPELEEASDEFDDEDLEEVESGSGKSGSGSGEVEELDLEEAGSDSSDEAPPAKGKPPAKPTKVKPEENKAPAKGAPAKGSKAKEAAAPTTSGLDLKIDLGTDDDARDVPDLGSSEEAEQIDSQIDLKLSGLDDDLGTLEEAETKKGAVGKPGKPPAKAKQKAPSSEEAEDDDLSDLDDADLDGDDDLDDDLDDMDLDDVDLDDDDDAPKGKKAPAKSEAKGKKAPAPAKKPAKKGQHDDDDDDDLDLDDIEIEDID